MFMLKKKKLREQNKKKKALGCWAMRLLLVPHALGGSVSVCSPFDVVVHASPDEQCDKRLDVASTILGHSSHRRRVSSGPFASHCSIEMCRSMM